MVKNKINNRIPSYKNNEGVQFYYPSAEDFESIGLFDKNKEMKELKPIEIVEIIKDSSYQINIGDIRLYLSKEGINDLKKALNKIK